MPAITIPLVTQPTPFTTIGRYDSPLAGATGQNTGQDIFQVFDTRGQIVTHMNSNGSIDPPLFPQNVITPISSFSFTRGERNLDSTSCYTSVFLRRHGVHNHRRRHFPLFFF